MVRSQEQVEATSDGVGGGEATTHGHEVGRGPHAAVRLARAAFIVQAAAVGFHQSWHAIGFAEPPSDVGHYLLLHFPLHLGVVLLVAAAVWLTRRTAALSLPLVLLAAGALVQLGGVLADVLAVFGDTSHTPGAALLAGGGLLALTAPAVRWAQQRR